MEDARPGREGSGHGDVGEALQLSFLEIREERDAPQQLDRARLPSSLTPCRLCKGVRRCCDPDKIAGRGQFAGAAAEAGADQGLLVAGADHRLAVEFLDRQFRQVPRDDGVGERLHRGAQLGLLHRAQAQQAAAAALDEDLGLAVAQQQVGAGVRPGRRPPSSFGQGRDAP